MMDNIILIGFMGCGKTSTGCHLAQVMNYRFLDTDQVIEEECQEKITDIFKNNGEEYFRNLETSTIEKMICSLNKSVISTGGGLPLRECNGSLLRKLGFVVYLRVSKDTVLQRLKGDVSRPLLQGKNMPEKIERLLAFRDPLYQVAAHVIIDADKKEIEEVSEEILRNFRIMMLREKEKRDKEWK